MRKQYLFGGLAGALLFGAVAAWAQTAYPLQASVTGTEIIKNEASPTGAYFTAAQMASYAGRAITSFTSPLVTFGANPGTPTHIASAQTTAPALTGCGTGSPAIVGTDTAGIVTMGTAATGCVITFNTAYTSAPYCVASWIATPLASQSYVTSAAAITLTQTSTSGNKAQYICMAQAGG